MKGIEQVKLDEEIIAIGFRRKRFLKSYKYKCRRGIININLDLNNCVFSYSATFSVRLFGICGSRFFTDNDNLLIILNRLIQHERI